MWSTAQRQKKVEDLMLMLDMNETIDQLAIVNNVGWYGDVLMREGGHVLRALDLKGEDQRKKEREVEKDTEEG